MICALDINPARANLKVVVGSADQKKLDNSIYLLSNFAPDFLQLQDQILISKEFLTSELDTHAPCFIGDQFASQDRFPDQLSQLTSIGNDFLSKLDQVMSNLSATQSIINKYRNIGGYIASSPTKTGTEQTTGAEQVSSTSIYYPSLYKKYSAPLSDLMILGKKIKGSINLLKPSLNPRRDAATALENANAQFDEHAQYQKLLEVKMKDLTDVNEPLHDIPTYNAYVGPLYKQIGDIETSVRSTLAECARAKVNQTSNSYLQLTNSYLNSIKPFVAPVDSLFRLLNQFSNIELVLFQIIDNYAMENLTMNSSVGRPKTQTNTTLDAKWDGLQRPTLQIGEGVLACVAVSDNHFVYAIRNYLNGGFYAYRAKDASFNFRLSNFNYRPPTMTGFLSFRSASGKSQVPIWSLTPPYAENLGLSGYDHIGALNSQGYLELIPFNMLGFSGNRYMPLISESQRKYQSFPDFVGPPPTVLPTCVSQ